MLTSLPAPAFNVILPEPPIAFVDVRLILEVVSTVTAPVALISNMVELICVCPTDVKVDAPADEIKISPNGFVV